MEVFQRNVLCLSLSGDQIAEETEKIFNAVLIRLVAQVKISLLLKIQWGEHDYLSEHRCGSVWELWSHDHDDTESGSTHRARGEDVEIGIG